MDGEITYHGAMARGWESKSVELQQSDAGEKPARPALRLTPEQKARERDRVGLTLSRTRILQQLQAAQNPRHREMLQRAVTDLDRRLAQLEPKVG
jgi:hypothetical protein